MPIRDGLGPVRGYIRKRIPDCVDAWDDIESDVTLGILSLLSKESYRGEASIGTIMIAIAKNKVTDYLRGKRNHAELEGWMMPTRDTTQHKIENEELSEGLGKEMESLPRRQRNVMTLLYNGVLTNREVGTVLGISASAVNLYKKISLNKMRKQLKINQRRMR